MGILSQLIYFFLIRIWGDCLTITAIHPLSKSVNFRSRDLVQIIFFLFTITALFKTDRTSGLHSSVIWAGYRLLDLSAITISIAIFSKTTTVGSIQIFNKRRRQRILVNIMFNYIEAIACFAVIFRFLHFDGAFTFEKVCDPDVSEFLLLSISIITSSGFNNLENQCSTLQYIIIYQLFLGILIFATLIATLMAGIPSAREKDYTLQKTRFGGFYAILLHCFLFSWIMNALRKSSFF